MLRKTLDHTQDNIFAEIRSYEYGMKEHIHEFAQLVIVLSGELEISVNADEHRLHSHNTLFIPKLVDHEFEMSRNGECMVLDIGLSNQSTGMDMRRPFALDQITPQSRRYFEFVKEEIELAGGTPIEHESLLKTAVDLIFSQASAKPERIDPKLDEALTVLSQINETRTIKEIARSLGLSQSSLNRLLIGGTGKSPKQVQQKARFRFAIERLASTNEPISTIAYEIGYENLSSFTNAFTRSFGIAPSQFRSTKKKNS